MKKTLKSIICSGVSGVATIVAAASSNKLIKRVAVITALYTQSMSWLYMFMEASQETDRLATAEMNERVKFNELHNEVKKSCKLFSDTIIVMDRLKDLADNLAAEKKEGE